MPAIIALSQQLQQEHIVARIAVYYRFNQYLNFLKLYYLQLLRNMDLVVAYDFTINFHCFGSIFPIQLKQYYQFTSLFPCKYYLVGMFRYLIQETIFPHFFASANTYQHHYITFCTAHWCPTTTLKNHNRWHFLIGWCIASLSDSLATYCSLYEFFRKQ